MSFINFPSPTPVFPTLPPLGWSMHKQPSFMSTVTKAATGRECQLIRAVYPRWEFTLKYGDDSWLREQTQNIETDPRLAGFTELEQISGLFLQCLGAYGEFYYDDPNDNTRQLDYGHGDGIKTVYQLVYTWGVAPALPFVAPVTGINEILQVTIGGMVLDPSQYTVDATNTKIVFLTPPLLDIVIAYSFYYRCRFLADMSEYQQWAKNLWENKEVKFQSVKP